MSESISLREKNGTTHASPYRRRSQAPLVDVFENTDELLLAADIPGVSSEGIDLRVENDMLLLEARRSATQSDSPALVREYEEVDFTTTFRIPAGIDTGAIAAETKNGTLRIRLPKAAAAKPRKIAVTGNGS